MPAPQVPAVPVHLEPSHRRRRSGLVAAGLAAATIVAGAATGSHSLPPPWRADRGSAHGVRLSTALDRARVQSGGDGTVRLEVVMAGEAPAAGAAAVVATDLVVAIDTSGSMQGRKLADAKAAVRELLAQLGPGDRFALLRYADDATVAIPLAAPPETGRGAWLAQVDALQAGGATNIGAALAAADALLAPAAGVGRLGRVLLISDGIPTAGEVGRDELVARAAAVARGEHVLTAVGVGADFNESLMTALADAGTGNYYYIDGDAQLATVFAGELRSARDTVASGLVLRLQPPPGVRVLGAAGYPLERDGDAAVLRPGSLFAGQERRLWVTLALPTDRLGSVPLPEVSLAFDGGGARRTLRVHDLPAVACVAGEDEFVAGVDKDAWGRAVLQEEQGRMKQQVADSLRRGDRAAAEQAIEAYRAPTAALNRAVGSAAVGEALSDLDAYAAEVKDAFEGADQRDKQNKLGKESGAAGWDMRRQGAKR